MTFCQAEHSVKGRMYACVKDDGHDGKHRDVLGNEWGVGR